MTTSANDAAGAPPSLPWDVATRLDAVPLFQGRPIRVEPLPGGLTNRNFRVDLDGGTFVARLSSPSGNLLAIDRDAEYAHSVSAAAVGMAPRVVAYAPQVSILVVEWVPGRTLTEADVRDDAWLPRIAGACRRLHAGPAFTTRFDMFALQRRYLAVVTERGFRMPPGYCDFLPVAARIEAALAQRPVPLVPCHNDLLAANMIDDGERLWFVDFEYSGNNDPYFELGNIWSESGLALGQLDLLVAAYAGRPSRSMTARARLFGLMAQYGWTLWASIQDGVSPLDVDFLGWGAEKYDRASAGFRGPDLPRLLEEVHLDD